MAYQSQFTGSQIDEVILRCREGKNLDNLSQLDNIYNDVKNNISAINDIVNGDNGTKKLSAMLETKLSKKGDTLTGQLNKSNDCKKYLARDKSILKLEKPNKYAPIYSCAISGGDIHCGVQPGSSSSYEISWNYTSDTDYVNKKNIDLKQLAKITSLGQVFGAVWNDFAEFRKSSETEPGRVICENGDGTLSCSHKRLQPGAMVISDTYGFAIGQTKECNTPVAVAGRVLAYPYEDWWTFEPGEPVCSGPNGTVSKMTRREVKKYPERIIGTVSELPIYETWGEHNINVNGRIWIRIK